MNAAQISIEGWIQLAVLLAAIMASWFDLRYRVKLHSEKIHDHDKRIERLEKRLNVR